MKKTTLLLIIFFTISIFSQDKLISGTNEYFDGSSWIEYGKAEYTYDGAYNLIEEKQLYWDGQVSQWKISFKATNTFNANKKVIVSLYQDYDTNTNSIDSESRTSYTYNSNGDLTQYIDEEWSGSAWVNSYKLGLTYTNDKITSGFSYAWNGTQWYFEGQNSEQYTLSYNSNGFISSFNSDEWNGSNWVVKNQMLFSYNPNNSLILEESQSWNGASWDAEDKQEITYDANGNAILEERFYLDNGVFVLSESMTIAFDTSKLLSSYAHPFKDNTGIEFLLSGVRIVNKILSRNDSEFRTVYNYNEGTASVNDLSLVNFNVYPNPTSSFLKIDDSGFALRNIEIYSVLGKKVMTSTKNELNIENLVNGIYVLKIQSKEGSFTTKRIVKN
jgi:hypothetical protein